MLQRVQTPIALTLTSPTRRRSVVNKTGRHSAHEASRSWPKSEERIQHSSVVLNGEESLFLRDFVATNSLKPEQVIFEFSSSLTITSIDAEKDPEIGEIVKGRSELIQLTLWLMVEKQRGEQSLWHPFLTALPERTHSPILWTNAELKELLQGSPVLDEAILRREALKEEWQELRNAYDVDVLSDFTEEEFIDAFSVVLGYAFFLPNAGRFALLPPLFGLQRTGSEPACTLDYNAESGSVILTSNTYYVSGDRVRIFDDRSSGEIFLASGNVEAKNPSDHVYLEYELVPADRLYSAKRQVLESLGYSPKETFAIYFERFPSQLLSFLRLSRVQDVTELTKVSFAEDIIISEMNEYEVLQLILGECRVRLSRYTENAEFDMKTLQSPDISEKQRLAAQLLLSEKRILQSCVDFVRQRLAPIRGIPTKSGALEDPNKDILEMFNAIESIPQAPKKLFDGLLSWAKGEYDPDWNKKQNKKT